MKANFKKFVCEQNFLYKELHPLAPYVFDGPGSAKIEKEHFHKAVSQKNR